MLGLSPKLWLFNYSCANKDLRINECESMSLEYLKSSLHKISQGRIINRIIKYRDTVVDARGNKTLKDIFKNKNKVRGLCFGLTNMFLFAAFISDVHDLENQDQKQDKDNLHWFYKCVYLLHSNINFNKFTSKQHEDIVRFIVLVRHFHNSTNLESCDAKNNNLFIDPNNSESKKRYVRRGSLRLQPNHRDNVEFTGKNILSFDHEIYETFSKPELDVFKSKISSPEPLYIDINFSFDVEQFVLPYFRTITLRQDWHAVCLHKDKYGKFTYFDPNFGISEIDLSTSEQITKFKHQLLQQYKPDQGLTYTIGTIKANQKKCALNLF